MPTKSPFPAKLHHTPKGFRNNYVESVAKSAGDLLRWQMDRIRNQLPPKPTLPTPQTPADMEFIRRNAVAGGEMIPAVTWIGHASTLVQASGLNVLTDPIFSKRASPVQFLGPARVTGAVELDWWDSHEVIGADGRRAEFLEDGRFSARIATGSSPATRDIARTSAMRAKDSRAAKARSRAGVSTLR